MLRTSGTVSSFKSLVSLLSLTLNTCVPYIISLFICPAILFATEVITPQVISKIPHPLPAFTQGLAIMDDILYESTGLYGRSFWRTLDLQTGRVLQTHKSPSVCFAEGIALFPPYLIQLTWRERAAVVYSLDTGKWVKMIPYEKEGWGMCRDKDAVWTSDGTDLLVQRDGATLNPIKNLRVRFADETQQPVRHLNDIECKGNEIFANVWLTDQILRIDKVSGTVTAVIDASHLLNVEERKNLPQEATLNGIAYRTSTGTFFITGKEWPWIYEVRF